MIAVYVSIGNSDDKLPQRHWARYVADVRRILNRAAVEVHGEWFSAPDATWQNACWCIVLLEDQQVINAVQAELRSTADAHLQESVAWAVATVQFLTTPRAR